MTQWQVRPEAVRVVVASMTLAAGAASEGAFATLGLVDTLAAPTASDLAVALGAITAEAFVRAMSGVIGDPATFADSIVDVVSTLANGAADAVGLMADALGVTPEAALQTLALAFEASGGA